MISTHIRIMFACCSLIDFDERVELEDPSRVKALAIASAFNDVVDLEAARLEEKYSEGAVPGALELNGVLARDWTGDLFFEVEMLPAVDERR